MALMIYEFNVAYDIHGDAIFLMGQFNLFWYGCVSMMVTTSIIICLSIFG